MDVSKSKGLLAGKGMLAGLAVLAAAGIGAGAFWHSTGENPVATTAVADQVRTAELETPRGSSDGSTAAKPTTAASTGEDAEFGARVRRYLLQNPGIIMEVQRALEVKMEREQAARTKAALAKHKDALTNPKLNLVAGNPDGDITVVEFFDYNCGFCRRAVGAMNRLIESDKNVRLILQEMPIFGKESEDAARMAIAARKQGKYWELHAGLLKAKGRASGAAGLRVAEELGLNIEQLKKDAASDETTQFIRKAQRLGRSLGIQGTPHFFVGDEMIAGAPEDLYGQLRSRIAKQRAAKKG